MMPIHSLASPPLTSCSLVNFHFLPPRHKVATPPKHTPGPGVWPLAAPWAVLGPGPSGHGRISGSTNDENLGFLVVEPERAVSSKKGRLWLISGVAAPVGGPYGRKTCAFPGPNGQKIALQHSWAGRCGCCGPHGPLGRAEPPIGSEILSFWCPKVAPFDRIPGGHGSWVT